MFSTHFHTRRCRKTNLIERLDLRVLLASVGWDGNGDGVSWADPLNWSTDILPCIDDDVTIDVAGTPTITLSGTCSVKSLTSAESLYLGSGTLSVEAASSVSANLTLSGGTLTGAGDLTVNGPFTWNFGTMGGSGVTTVNGTTTIDVFAYDSANLDESRRLVLNGDAAAGGGHASDFGIRAGGTSTLEVAAGRTLTLNDGIRLSRYDGGGSASLVNRGTIVKATAEASRVDLSLVNLGALHVNTGTLQIEGSTNIGSGAFLSAGRYFVADGAAIGFATPITTLTADLEVDGSGTVSGLDGLNVNRGRIALTGGADLSITPTGGTHTQEGILDLSPGSVFTVNGDMNFAGVSQPVVRTEVASGASFGSVVITGALNLNSPDSTSRFDPDLVDAYDPAIGVRHDVIVAAGGISNGFDSFQGGATPSGNILLATRPDLNTVAIEVGPGPLPPAPQILSQAFEYETREAVVFSFNQDVSAFLGRKDFELRNLTTNTVMPQSVGTLSYNATSNQATLLLTHQLPDGLYRLTVLASDIANSAGVPASGSNIVLDFRVLRGDANRDQVVSFDDLLIVAQHYGTSPGVYSTGDFNYDGAVNFDDLLVLAQNYGRSLIAGARSDSLALAAQGRRHGRTVELLA